MLRMRGERPSPDQFVEEWLVVVDDLQVLVLGFLVHHELTLERTINSGVSKDIIECYSERNLKKSRYCTRTGHIRSSYMANWQCCI